MRLIIDEAGRLSGRTVTEEEGALMVLSGLWVEGSSCADELCQCRQIKTLRCLDINTLEAFLYERTAPAQVV